MSLNPSNPPTSTPQQKSFKPLMLTGVIPIVQRNRVRFLNGQTVSVGKFCDLYEQEGKEFDPINYCVMSITKEQTNEMSGLPEQVSFRFIANMTKPMYEAFIRLQQAAYRKSFEDSLYIDAKVHLFSKRGIYRIDHMLVDKIGITCDKWVNEFDRGERASFIDVVDISDIKCLAGGLHNHDFA
jgi:hypothetical protein